MKVTRFTLRAFAAGAMLAASVAAYPQGGDSLRVESALATKYTGFAGSQQNALALVGGLRSGSQITLQPAGTSCALPPPVITPPGGGPILPPGGTLPPPPVPPASFAPPTGDMGYGNVDIALNLGQ